MRAPRPTQEPANRLNTDQVREAILVLRAATREYEALEARTQKLLDRLKPSIIGRTIFVKWPGGNLTGDYQITDLSFRYDLSIEVSGLKKLPSGKLGSQSRDLGTLFPYMLVDE